MTEDIKKEITITKDVTLLTKVTCDCCRTILGMFVPKNPIVWNGFKPAPEQKEVEWYHVTKSQSCNMETTNWEFDICPNCLPLWVTSFRDNERGCDDNIELYLKHHIDYPQILEEESDLLGKMNEGE